MNWYKLHPLVEKARIANTLDLFHRIAIFDEIMGKYVSINKTFPPKNHLTFRLMHKIPAKDYYDFLRKHNYEI